MWYNPCFIFIFYGSGVSQRAPVYKGLPVSSRHRLPSGFQRWILRPGWSGSTTKTRHGRVQQLRLADSRVRELPRSGEIVSWFKFHAPPNTLPSPTSKENKQIRKTIPTLLFPVNSCKGKLGESFLRKRIASMAKIHLLCPYLTGISYTDMLRWLREINMRFLTYFSNSNSRSRWHCLWMPPQRPCIILFLGEFWASVSRHHIPLMRDPQNGHYVDEGSRGLCSWPYDC